MDAAGGPGFVLRELLDSGCLHADAATMNERGLRAYTEVPELVGERRGGKIVVPPNERDLTDGSVRTLDATGLVDAKAREAADAVDGAEAAELEAARKAAARGKTA